MGNLACCEDPSTHHDDDEREFKVIKSSGRPKLLLFFVRHSERIDQVDKLSPSEEATKLKNPKCDPSLTDNGKQIA